MRTVGESKSCSKIMGRPQLKPTLLKNNTIDIQGLLKQRQAKKELESVDNSVNIIDTLRQSRELLELREIVSSESLPRIEGLIHDEFDSERIKQMFRQVDCYKIEKTQEKVPSRSSSLVSINALLRQNPQVNAALPKKPDNSCETTAEKNCRPALKDKINRPFQKINLLEPKKITKQLKINKRNIVEQISQSLKIVQSLTLAEFGYKSHLSDLSSKVTEFKNVSERHGADQNTAPSLIRELEDSVTEAIYFRAQYRRISNEFELMQRNNQSAEPQNILLRAAKRSYMKKSISNIAEQIDKVIKRVSITMKGSKFIDQFRKQTKERLELLGQAAQINIKSIPQLQLKSCIKEIKALHLNLSQQYEIRDLCRENGIEF